MPELIDRDALIQNYCGACANKEFCAEESCPYYEIRRRIENAPTIEAEPIRHGRFVFEKGDGKTCLDGWICTACKFDYHTNVPYFADFKYCPTCGARMDGGADNG